MRLSLLRSLSYGVKNSPAAAESHRSRFLFHRSFLPGTFNTTRIQFSNAAIIHQELKTQVQQFDIELPVEKAITPPSSWFTQKTFHLKRQVRLTFLKHNGSLKLMLTSIQRHQS